ncbi:glycerophosphodiester phosphodiesterase GDPD1, chloroplastic-like [Macadamia integrifolia]|uniref:glycerophosphodiester phosphodiesterase GDPD1, chloroplastic-like n=1 Tax=Macadamia integrifolia TaxID=60698 RepID=UPI001C501654|nr:glycerophosphodiester phosphodiesterase GDPD1, chloroplastic-like [Macadamia integrifolia]
MALKAVFVSDVPSLDQVPEHATTAIYSSRFSKGNDGGGRASLKWPKFSIIGHRGSGMNMLHSPDRRMQAIKENSILSFNTAGKFAVDFVEFDVQVTKDDCPVIFHDDFILTEENGQIFERRLTELTSAEFLSYGPKREPGNVGKTLLRKTKDGRIFNWKVEEDDAFCTLQEAFQKVTPSLGFNIELKFDDHIVYRDEELIHVLQAVLRVVFEFATERPIIFSTFQPDAARLIKLLQSIYPVYFLTNGGTEIYTDVRRNSLEEAVKLCLACGLQGIVSEVKAIFRNPATINMIREANLSLLSYGQLNNVPEAVYMQHLMGVDGVIVDLVKEITTAVSDYINPVKEGEEDGLSAGDGQIQIAERPKFSQREISFLLKLIPELIQV